MKDADDDFNALDILDDLTAQFNSFQDISQSNAEEADETELEAFEVLKPSEPTSSFEQFCRESEERHTGSQGCNLLAEVIQAFLAQNDPLKAVFFVEQLLKPEKPQAILNKILLIKVCILMVISEDEELQTLTRDLMRNSNFESSVEGQLAQRIVDNNKGSGFDSYKELESMLRDFVLNHK